MSELRRKWAEAVAERMENDRKNESPFGRLMRLVIERDQTDDDEPPWDFKVVKKPERGRAMTTRTIQQIIEGDEEPTNEERARIDAVLAQLHMQRFERAAEYAKRPDASGYVCQMIVDAPLLTTDDLRSEWQKHQVVPALEQLIAAISEK